ncbi:MAG TPA: DUF6607 family protein [Gammaproteobacteria bacterium]|nr:DUF6607 family protein [Gammaproteobacteria bacterium]
MKTDTEFFTGARRICGTLRRYAGCGVLLVAAQSGFAQQAQAQAQEHGRPHQFTFSWPFEAGDQMAPRGGTSRGAAVQLAPGPSPQWQALQQPDISPVERDRRAILAMAGDYRASFDFIETVGFVAGFEPARPYQSWGTERIYVVEDSPRRIVLQHVMAMFVADAQGNVRGPYVQKHWRQQWDYEPSSLHVYAGSDRWKKIVPDAVEGRWAQTVFQVDDSPRYAAIGEWEHNGSFSAWRSSETMRPLPRRESSVRTDYSVLLGTNRHTILPGGWVQEEENLKTVLDSDGSPAHAMPYVARELGVNRYELVEDFDFSGADAYWEATAEFWADVRRAWQRVFDDQDEFVMREEVAGVALWQVMFDYAAGLESGADYDAQASRRFVDETLERYVR